MDHLEIPPGPLPSFITTSFLAISIVLPILATLAVGLRFYIRYLKNHSPSLDDWVITLALLCAWGVSIVTFVVSKEIGVNYSTVDILSGLTVFSRAIWAENFPRLTSLALVKIAILLFYNRIFITPVFRISAWVYIGILIAWNIPNCVALLLVAIPITGVWTVTETNSARYNLIMFDLASTIMSLVFDITVLCFPLPVIRKLQMPWKQKLQVIGIFWLGIFCCIAAAIRLHYVCSYITLINLGEISTILDLYQESTPVFLWGIVEANFSIFTACLPTYGLLFKGTRSVACGRGSSSRGFPQKPMIGVQVLREFPLKQTDGWQLWRGLDGTNHCCNIETQDTAKDTASLSSDLIAPQWLRIRTRSEKEKSYSRNL